MAVCGLFLSESNARCILCSTTTGERVNWVQAELLPRSILGSVGPIIVGRALDSLRKFSLPVVVSRTAFLNGRSNVIAKASHRKSSG